MPHPKKKTSKAAKNQRRSHHALKSINLIKCPKCEKAIKPHTVCDGCGFYKGKEYIDMTKKLPRKQRAKIEKKKVKEESKELKKINKESEKIRKIDHKSDRIEGIKSVVRGDK
ncbi:50S ribosomal protein L32 [Patescibacteria group bacterium]|nr:50S ribosomal protein L32 [Patescibacteria group bacterium]